eukprot:CAMPEP_0114241332 /NCGR_PEP_ID=MMETSP0058-20121206/9576_1 /TAXON_ID=36894 /ORGANISM="Pyramimonas parkeae, CCMP726" /LENGTH=449 /DNA_ID=CAMNT_0001353851 /DNA_START=418 /DNA_END=1767 /DNA_ORIENTATION=+
MSAMIFMVHADLRNQSFGEQVRAGSFGIPGRSALPGHVSFATLKTQFASLKRQAEANIRGSKLLEEKQSVGDAAADLVKSYIRNMNAKIPKLHRTPSSARSLLQDDEYEFKWADTSSACQSTLRDAGNTDIAALDAMDSSDDADIPWPADLAPCKGVLDITLDMIFGNADPSFEDMQNLSDFCSLGCKEKALTWLETFSATCSTDTINLLVNIAKDAADTTCESNSLSGDSCTIVKVLVALPVESFAEHWALMDSLVLMYRSGCATGSDAKTCWSRSWWFAEIVSIYSDDSDGIGDDGCDAMVTCDTLMSKQYCEISDTDTSSMETDCCYTTTVGVGATLNSVGCAYSGLITELLQYIGAPVDTCSTDVCANQARLSSWIQDTLDKVHSCCEAPNEIATPCMSSSQLAADMSRNAFSSLRQASWAGYVRVSSFVGVSLMMITMYVQEMI